MNQPKLNLVCCNTCGEWLGKYGRPNDPPVHELCAPCANFDEDLDAEHEDSGACCGDPCVHISLYEDEAAYNNDDYYEDLYPTEITHGTAYFSRREQGRLYPSHETGDVVDCCNCGEDYEVRWIS